MMNRRSRGPTVLLGPLLAALVPAGPPAQPTAAAVTETARGFDRALDLLLQTGSPQESATLVLLLDPTASLAQAGFAQALQAALERAGPGLSRTSLGLWAVDRGRILPHPAAPALVVEKARELLGAPEEGLKNLYDDLRQLAAQLAGTAGRKRILLVSLENGDAEDNLDGTANALARARAELHVLGREALLGDTWWLSRPADPPRGCELAGPEGPFPDVPWAWLLQPDSANEHTPSGFGLYGLARLAAESGGRFFLYLPAQAGRHLCAEGNLYTHCPFCPGDHLPAGEGYQPPRLEPLAPATLSRKKAWAAAHDDPCFRPLLEAWTEARKADLIRSHPPSPYRWAPPPEGEWIHDRPGRLMNPNRLERTAAQALEMAKSCDRIRTRLEEKLEKSGARPASSRYRAIADLAALNLKITRLNLLLLQAWCREVGPTLAAPPTAAPPEAAAARDRGPDYVETFGLSLCHGVRPFLELHLPGREELKPEFLALADAVDRFLATYEHTPYAAGLRHSSLAVFRPVWLVPGVAAKLDRNRTRSRTEDPPQTGLPRPARPTPGGQGQPAGPTTGGR